MKELELCQIAEQETDSVLAFFRENSSRYIRNRPASMLARAVKNMNVMAISELDSGSLVAVAGCFDYLDFGAFELGFTRVTLNGYGLQRLLLSARLLLIYTTTAEAVPVFTVVDSSNSRALSSIGKHGFEAWQPSSDLIDARASKLSVSPDQSNGKFFQYHWRNIGGTARGYLASIESPLTHRSDESLVSVQINHPWLSRPQTLADISRIAS